MERKVKLIYNLYNIDYIILLIQNLHSSVSLVTDRRYKPVLEYHCYDNVESQLSMLQL